MIEAKDEGLAVAKALFRYPHEQRFCKLEQVRLRYLRVQEDTKLE